jgi:hypothetical protein
MKPIPQTPGSGLYQIRIRGVLDEKWMDWFDGFALTWVNQNETWLTGKVKDQAGLHGILGRIRDLGLDLLLVKKIDCVCTGKNPVERGSAQEITVFKHDKEG